MATAKAILNKRYKSKDGSYPIVIRLINGDDQLQRGVGHKVLPKSFKDGYVKETHPDADIINSVINSELGKAKKYFSDCTIQGIPIDLSQAFNQVRQHSFTEYLRHRAKQHEAAEQIEMYFKVNRFAKELVECFERELYFNEVNEDLLRRFDNWLKIDQENAANTRAKKFEFIGKYFGKGVKEKKLNLDNPFKDYKIKTEPVKKEKLTVKQLTELEDLPLKDGPVKFARDLFMFSYYCKGIRFETCITMKKTALVNGRLYFRINKGLKHLSVLMHPRLEAIINTYIQNDTDTIFGRVQEVEKLTAKQYRSLIGSENAMVNRSLKDAAFETSNLL
jgi:integrase/recombinase XerD